MIYRDQETEWKKDFPMTLSSSPLNPVWTRDPLDQFTAEVWAGDERRSEQNHLICKFHNDSVSSTSREPRASNQITLKCYTKSKDTQANEVTKAKNKLN